MSKELQADQSALGIRIAGTPKDGQRLSLTTGDALQQIFGTKDPETASALMQHCLKVLKDEEASDDFPGNDERHFMVGTVADIKPRDTVESMLAVQMAATHVAMVRSARWLAHTKTVEQVQCHYNGYTKLARAFALQVETLRKYRNGGQQTVTVQHVNVEGGGQAIVGNVQTGGVHDK